MINNNFNKFIIIKVYINKMGSVQRRKGNHSKNKFHHRTFNKTKNYMKDHDQIHDDLLNPNKYEKL
jgi:hypothetical protein